MLHSINAGSHLQRRETKTLFQIKGDVGMGVAGSPYIPCNHIVMARTYGDPATPFLHPPNKFFCTNAMLLIQLSSDLPTGQVPRLHKVLEKLSGEFQALTLKGVTFC